MCVGLDDHPAAFVTLSRSSAIREWPTAVAHNGNLVNTATLRAELQEQGCTFETSNDSEVIGKKAAGPTSITDCIEEHLGQAMLRLQGAYSPVLTPVSLSASAILMVSGPLCSR